MENSTKGSIPAFLRSLPTHHKTTVISRFLFWKMLQEESLRKSLLWRQMTGKFRKVASHYAPEPAFGLFLNLPWGICPLEPRHVNSVSNPAKCPPDIPSEDLLIAYDAVLHLYKGALHSLIYPLLIYQPEMLWLILFMERRMKKGVKNLCENEIIR